MIIEINKDLDNYKESVILGLTATQFLYSAGALLCGALVVFLLYSKVGLVLSCYIATPVVAPIALGGFYSKNGMSFATVIGKMIRNTFTNRILTFSSTNTEMELLDAKRLAEMERKKEGQSRNDEAALLIKKVKLVGIGAILCIILLTIVLMANR
ncbi:MAG TPA: PrgI family protein [Lachnospiraceae bacterium]|nr:PrgI family protein [Lachnospiraceae bacterium]